MSGRGAECVETHCSLPHTSASPETSFWLRWLNGAASVDKNNLIGNAPSELTQEMPLPANSSSRLPSDFHLASFRRIMLCSHAIVSRGLHESR
jgi:hypothetical protein